MRFAPCLLILALALPAAAALRDADKPAALAVIAYGAANLDPTTGLIKDPSGVPNLPESSAGYVAACLELKENQDKAKAVLGAILDLQQRTGPLAGDFPWYGVTGGQPGDEAMLYLAPLLAYVARCDAAELGADLQVRLRAALDLIYKRLGRVAAAPDDNGNYLVRAAARATVGAALGNNGPSLAVGEVNNWLRPVARQGLPRGHSPTFDTARLVALKWIREVAPPAQLPTNRTIGLVTRRGGFGGTTTQFGTTSGGVTQPRRSFSWQTNASFALATDRISKSRSFSRSRWVRASPPPMAANRR